MNTLQRRAHRRPIEALPQELLTRFKMIKNKKYRDQVDALSIAFPHREHASFRWYLQYQDLPYLHILETRDHGNRMMLYALIPRLRSILVLEKINSDWHYSSLIHEENVEDVLPDRFRDGSDWLLKPASRSQRVALACQLRLPYPALPSLTAFNVQVLLQTTILMRHLPTVLPMVALVESRGEMPVT
jgi:hypothetical protein